MKRRAEHLDTGAGGHSMLKYLKDDVDWDAVHAETQARLMRSQDSFAFSSNGHSVQLNQEPMPFNQRRQQQQQQQPSTQLNSLHSYFQPQAPSVNTHPLHSKPHIHPQNQHHPTQLQPQQQRPEPQCAHCSIPASQSTMSYLSTQPLQSCHFCDRLACVECCQLCRACQEVFCRGCLVAGYTGNDGICLTCRY